MKIHFMFKRLLVISAFVALSLFLTRPTHASTHLVCIDPGHGGTDTGATMTGVKGTIYEKNETLDIGLKLQVLLSSAGVQTVMTRTTDITLTNADRYNTCNSAGANLELSIHLNGSMDHAIDYTQVLYGKKAKDVNWAKTLDNSMANLLAATGTGTIQNNGITNFADGVLLKSNMPAALAETVFITSTNEYNLLTNGIESRQQAIAQQLSIGVQNWFTGK